MAVLDLKMPGGSGLDLLKELRRADPSTRVLMLTGYGSIATAVQAVREGAVGYLPKPADADEILAALNGKEAEKMKAEATEKSACSRGPASGSRAASRPAELSASIA